MYIPVFRKIAAINIVDKLLFQKEESHSRTIWFIETDPKKIKNMSLISTRSSSLVGKSAYTGICNGGWDYYKFPFYKHILYKTTSDILMGKEFEQTSIFNRVRYKRMTHAEAINICEKLSRLIDILKEKGYNSQYEMGNLDNVMGIGNTHVPRHELVVGLDRHGELIRLIGGKHRLAVAQQIGIKRMSAILSIVHSKSLDYLPKKHRKITGNSEDFRPF